MSDEREVIKIGQGDAVMAQIAATLLASKGVHDINKDDIIQAGKIAGTILRCVVTGSPDAVT